MENAERKSDSGKKGRPSVKTPELIDEFIELVMQGHGLNQIAKLDHMPARQTILKWLIEDDELSARYARAKAILMDVMAEEIIEISDDASRDTEAFVGINHIHRARLKVDTRKWVMAKLSPKKYSDKLDITSDNQKITAVQVEIVHKPED